MPPVGFEPTISAAERPKTHALDRAATGIGTSNTDRKNIKLAKIDDKKQSNGQPYGVTFSYDCHSR
jgi:hypothetical protein